MALMFTISEDEKVLELIESGEDGLMIRDNEDWIPVEDDTPTVEDQEWLDVTEDALEFWDNAQKNDTEVTREDVLQFAD